MLLGTPPSALMSPPRDSTARSTTTTTLSYHHHHHHHHRLFLLIIILILSYAAAALAGVSANPSPSPTSTPPPPPPNPRPPRTDGTTSGPVRAASSHPMLFFGAEEAQAMRRRAAASHAPHAARLREAAREMLAAPRDFVPPREPSLFSAQWNEAFGNNLGALSFYCFLYPNHTRALHLALHYMDAMAVQPSWLVRGDPADEVPMAHSLVGFATAFDLLHGRLGPARRSLYLDAIVAAAGYMYERSFDRGWGQQYLHNHQPTNCVALLTAGLVVMAQGHLNDAYLWLSQAVLVMERALLLLREVRDGSLHEGVAYASYSTRSLLQYVHLLLRHLAVDHTGHPWLRQHFAFLYRTILPGFQRTVGIADSNYNWFYGPESQLAFLDAFVMRNGSGNWLADMIRKHRPAAGPGAPSRSQRWTTLHTEFIWFDASLTPRPPPDFGSPRLHIFHDWGVATYGAAQPAGANASFFSFKSGKIGGRAIYDIVHAKRYAAWVHGWRNFNPGHEHPDQNSFVFVPSRGGAGGGGGGAAPPPAACVTEALYGPKYTFLNNGLMFSPPAAPDVCFPPWQGQVTESCDSKWMRYKRGAAGDAHGRLERAQERGGVVFARGEAAGAYDAALGLASVQRSALLLRPDLLLVVDHVRRRPGSRASRMRAFFNNVDAGFRPVAVGALNGAAVAAPAGGDGGGVTAEACRMFWVDDAGVSARGKLSDSPFRSNHSFAGSYLASVVTPLRGAVTRAAFVFLGPSLSLRSLKVIPRNDSVTVYVIANSVLYTVYLRTDEATAPTDGGAGGGVGHGGAVAMVSTDRNTVFFDGGAELPEERPAEDEAAVEDYEAAVDRTLERLRDTFRELDERRNPRKPGPPGPPGGNRPRGGSRRTAEKRGSGGGGNRERPPKRPRASRTRDDGDHGGDAARKPAQENNLRADFGDSDFIDTAEMHDRGLPRWELNPGEDGEEDDAAPPSTPGEGGARGRGDRLPELRPGPADAAVAAAAPGGGFRNEPEAAGRSERRAAAVAPVPYARIFLLANACGFAALLVAQLRCAGRHWVLHNHRVLYALLIADSVAIFGIYSTCSRTDC
uniref:Dermatan-sulfate epimerase-like n=1 Tax=Petromyzon marinus TaxID=7757 RepID=A0AAJ7XFJ1_PETMA|nr:dermatan-sulfate epimerase-like [Petromyzon marinus]